jgi:hypothetical protein
MNDHRLDMTRSLLVLLSLVLAAGCGREERAALDQAKAAKDEVCACTTMTCRRAAMERYTAAASKMRDPEEGRRLAAAVVTCQSTLPRDAWKELIDRACQCKTPECAEEIQEAARQLASLSEPTTLRAHSDAIEKCLIEADDGLRLLTGIRDRACACTDAACAAAARQELKGAGKTPTMFMEKATDIGVETVNCLRKFE